MSALLIIFKIDRNASKTENVTSSLTVVCVSLLNALTQTSSFSLSTFHLIHEAKPYLLPSNHYSVSSRTNHSFLFPVTPSSSGPHCPPSHPINNPNPNQKTLTPTYHKMTSPPFLTSLQIPISLLVQPLRLPWTRPGLNRTQLCCRHCFTVLIRLPSYCSLFGLRSILAFNLLQRSSTQ